MYSWISLDSFYIDCKTVRSFAYSNTREKLVFQWVAQLWWRFSFSGKRNKHIFWAYPSTLKIAELYFEVLQFIRSTQLFPLTPSSRRHILHFTIYTIFYTEATLKAALELLDTSSRFEAKCRQ